MNFFQIQVLIVLHSTVAQVRVFLFLSEVAENHSDSELGPQLPEYPGRFHAKPLLSELQGLKKW